MSRKKRLSVAGALPHIMGRAIDGRLLFVDNDDRQMFLQLFESGLGETDYRCYAWALMGNHYHLLVRANANPLWMLMRKLNSNYARYYAKKYERRGYLFQDRFKSIATQDQGYIEELMRYVHLNPLRAGVCGTILELDAYEWCGHSAIIGKCCRRFQDVEHILARFGKDTETARRNYRQFIIDGIDKTDNAPFYERIRESNRETKNIQDYGCWVIGDRDFVHRSLQADRKNRIDIVRHQRLGVDLSRISEVVCKKMGIEVSELTHRGRNDVRSQARKIFAYVAYREFQFSVFDIANALDISNTAASRLAYAGEPLVRELGFSIEL